MNKDDFKWSCYLLAMAFINFAASLLGEWDLSSWFCVLVGCFCLVVSIMHLIRARNA